MSNLDSVKKPLKEYLHEFYEDSGKISELVRNLGFAGIGIIWIFKNDSLKEHILPEPLIPPLIAIVFGLGMDLLQYLWRAICNYIFYRIHEYRFDKGKLSEEDCCDLKMPEFISIGTWSFFILKLLFIAFAYYLLFNFLTSKF